MLTIDLPYLDTHLNLALSLYTQRLNYLEQFYLESSIQDKIEKRLLIHLHVLAQIIDINEAKPKDDADVFIYVSRRFLSDDQQHRDSAIQLLSDLLIDERAIQAVLDSCSLFYNSEIDELLKNLYKSHITIRTTILTIWHYKNIKLPLGLLNQSELQQNDNDLLAVVLKYQAEQSNIGNDLFYNYYRSLINNVENDTISPDAMHSALWGGLLRNDPSILIAIRRAIELESDESARQQYLRLAALTGNEDFLPVFKMIMENKPEIGSYLVALVGSVESVIILFSALQNPRISLNIIEAWRLITGKELRKVPSITVVNENSEENKNIPLIADFKSAEIWANKNLKQWDRTGRYIHGLEMTNSHLIELSNKLSGKIGKDIYDLLSLNKKVCVGLKVNSWVQERKEMLDAISG